MRRRDFVRVVGGTVATWPIAARAQQAGKLPLVGMSNASDASPRSVAFDQRLRELGWIEGRTIVIERRGAEGRSERAGEIASEFIRLKVDVIVAAGTPNVIATKQATSDIPIVFVQVADPVGAKLVASLARPGGNATGLSNQQTDITGKRLEILREVVPGLRRIGALVNISNPAAERDMREVHAVASTLGLEVTAMEIRRDADLVPAFEAVKGRVDGLYVFTDLLTFTNRTRINTLATAARLPSMHGTRDFVQAGGLISYAASVPDIYRRAAEMVDKILRGAKPADIPVEQPTKFELVVNLTTAKAFGLTIPEAFLQRADEVIE